MSMAEKIRMLLAKENKNLTELAEMLGTSQPNLWKKMKRDNFSEKELIEIAEAMGVKFEANFIYKDGTKI
ncbi:MULTISPECIES: helix-turn-helix domain-containing protein [Lysinibacillus]|uniref:helix-turn-helix domain-containing protein n=1 Tax=Lysinibacillus TaxID=400634 RepID=UPI00214AE4FB|nr:MULTISPECIES: helix-turn-helix domain-containing protein [Lysinibacillus]UUV23823.1 transcriptional regulator [Lysinibacillus sp. FN11]UYB46694.1 transcriptional regulator [Lysinibacillus capsici]